MSKALKLTAALAGCLVALTACGASSGGSTTSSSNPTASASSPYGPAPTIDPLGPTDPVLTVTGGSTGTTAFTMAQLTALGTSHLTIAEPFSKDTETFTVVPMAAIFTKAGVATAACVNTIALNDYRFRTEANAFTGSGGVIATELNGAPIPYDRGGPIRILFPDGTPLATNLDAWNWSLTRMEVAPVSPCTNPT